MSSKNGMKLLICVEKSGSSFSRTERDQKRIFVSSFVPPRIKRYREKERKREREEKRKREREKERKRERDKERKREKEKELGQKETYGNN